jgi:hypothetical protein
MHYKEGLSLGKEGLSLAKPVTGDSIPRNWADSLAVHDD